jgi:hypothetical protein
MNTTVLIFPEPISVARVSYLINTKGILPEIAHLDLEMVKMKLQDATEGKGWTAEQCDLAEVEYKRFLHLSKVFGKGNVPTDTIDTMWHYHILDTRAYHKDCDAVFGGYFHHYPYFGMRGEQDAKDLENAFYATAERYQATFGEAMLQNEQKGCWHDCSGRCWHACSDDK